MKYYDCYKFLIQEHGEEIVVKLIQILHKEGIDRSVDIADKAFTKEEKKKVFKKLRRFLSGVFGVCSRYEKV